MRVYDETDDVLTAGQIAKVLKVDRETVYRLVRNGTLPAFQIGPRWRFNRGQFDAWRMEQAEAATELRRRAHRMKV